MLKKELSNEEALSLAKDLCLTQYIDVSNLIDSLHIEQNKDTKICFVTTNKQVVESLLSVYYGILSSLNGNNVIKITIRYGDESYTVMTDYGEMLLDKEGFIKFLKKSSHNCQSSIMSHDDLYKNITLNIIYVPEYNRIDSDSWRCTFLEADKLIIALSASQILYMSEKNFINSLVLPYYSSSRLDIAIGNAQYIKSSEWKDAALRVKMQIGDEFEAFPIFTEEVSLERKQKYSGYDQNLSKILHECRKSVLDLRSTHIKDIDNYKMRLLEELLKQLKVKAEQDLSSGESGVILAQENEEVIAKSRKHIEDNVSLFLKSPLLAETRNAVDGFATVFKKSLKEDIAMSEDIKQDARSLTRYLSAIWSQFSENQNGILLREFEREASMLFEMMKLDLRHFTRNIHNSNIQEKIKEKLEKGFSVNTFFSRKTSDSNGLTDALTIGGVISGLIITPFGWLAVFASEIVKVVNKESMNNEYKEELKEKIDEIIDKNKTDLLVQAEKRFDIICKDFHNEIMKFYDEFLASINNIIKEEGEKKEKASEIIETINNLI